MKIINLLILALALAFLFACSSEEELPEGMHKVEVIEAMDAAGYTYMRVTEKGDEYWIAVPMMEVAKGEKLYYSRSNEMKNFHSKTLNRSFASILFVEDISKESPSSAGHSHDQMMHPKVNETAKEDVEVLKVEGGITVEEAYNDRISLSGKTVKIRGMVTKYNPDILGRNWIHIQDGTGKDNNYDLTVTSMETTSAGETIIIEGKLAVDKDFGSGYTYSVIIEDAKIIREQ